MTNEEAVKNLEAIKEYFEEQSGGSYPLCFGNARIALEKQIPKKPKYKTRISTVQGFLVEDIDVLCPSCNNRIYSIVDGEPVAGKKQKYCDNCGQALDWRNVK